MKIHTLIIASMLSIGIAQPSHAQSDRASIHGTVSAIGPDGQPFMIPGVTLQLTRASSSTEPATFFSNEIGEYAFDELPPGEYRLDASLQGFATFTRTVTVRAADTAVVPVRLEIAAVHEEVTVTANADDGFQERKTAPATEIKQRTLQQVPIATEHFQNALPLVPGVVRGPDGLLSMKGAREAQNGLRVNDASVADPVTGAFTFRLPIEAVQSLEVMTSPYAPEYGQISGGVTNIQTSSGTAQWKLEVQDVEPRLRFRGGRLKGIESWTPRVAIGGPIAPATTIFQSLEYQFTKNQVEGLPPLEADTRLESLSVFSHVDWNAGPSDHVSVALAAFPQKLGYVGLNTFNPQPVTPNVRQRGYLWTTGDRRVINARAMLDAHFSVTTYDSDVFPSTAGPTMMLGPEQNSGGYFNSQRRNSHAYEGVATYTTTPAWLAGSHLVKLGVGVTHDRFDGSSESRPVILLRADGSRLQDIDTPASARLAGSKTDVLAFVQDAWTAGDRLVLDYGVRFDRDTVANTSHVAPRAGFSFMPVPGGRTVVRGGAGLFYDKITLSAVTFDQMTPRRVTNFDTAGGIDGIPSIERFAIDGSRPQDPRSVAWNLAVDRELTRHASLRVGYQQRDGSREFIVDPVDVASGTRAIDLSNSGHSRYRELELTGRYRVAANQLVLSYVRSAASGDLNDLSSFVGNLENPIVRSNESSRLSFDAPNRVLAWGEFDLPGGYGIAPLVELRDGFPLSVFDERRDFVGGRNRAGRFPRFLSMDLQAWKHVTLAWPRKLNARVGVKVFNVTNHFNPRDFQGNLASAEFGAFSNGVSRTFRGKFVIDF